MFKIRLTARAIYNETSVVNIHAGSNIDMVPKIKGNYFFHDITLQAYFKAYCRDFLSKVLLQVFVVI